MNSKKYDDKKCAICKCYYQEQDMISFNRCFGDYEHLVDVLERERVKEILYPNMSVVEISTQICHCNYCIHCITEQSKDDHGCPKCNKDITPLFLFIDDDEYEDETDETQKHFEEMMIEHELDKAEATEVNEYEEEYPHGNEEEEKYWNYCEAKEEAKLRNECIECVRNKFYPPTEENGDSWCDQCGGKATKSAK